MRPDGFGGSVVLITADRICGKSTDDVLDELIEESLSACGEAAPGERRGGGLR
jgi:hypothetical protein